MRCATGRRLVAITTPTNTTRFAHGRRAEEEQDDRVPVESLLTVEDAALAARVHRLFTHAGGIGWCACCAGADVEPTVATVAVVTAIRCA